MHGYVGKTKFHPEVRAEQHWDLRVERQTYKDRWLCKLSSPPQLVILECCTNKNWQKKERSWIRDLRLGCMVLTNTAEGGIGSSGYVWTDGQKRRQGETLKGRPKSEETKKRISASLIGMKYKQKAPYSEEHREKIGRFRRGKTWEEIYGTKQALKMKQKISVIMKRNSNRRCKERLVNEF